MAAWPGLKNPGIQLSLPERGPELVKRVTDMIFQCQHVTRLHLMLLMTEFIYAL